MLFVLPANAASKTQHVKDMNAHNIIVHMIARVKLFVKMALVPQVLVVSKIVIVVTLQTVLPLHIQKLTEKILFAQIQIAQKKNVVAKIHIVVHIIAHKLFTKQAN